ncbi:hypothetical protein Fmac_000017 [Flemingia macrophylla]|uniref:GPI inositol-deacylase n=1 Tax=Flemingia macrophylla TaxID=520843 RepID=A0ABD1ND24_9FABA
MFDSISILNLTQPPSTVLIMTMVVVSSTIQHISILPITMLQKLYGFATNSIFYKALKQTNHGMITHVGKARAAVEDPMWRINIAKIGDSNLCRNFIFPRLQLNVYLSISKEIVKVEKEEYASATVSLIGHSAGGWLARVYMEQFGLSHVSLLLTLGTPHLPPPKGVSGVIDQTRGLLHYVQQNCSKPVDTPQLKYVCIAGRYIKGARFFGNSDPTIEAVVPTDSSQLVSDPAIINTATSPSNTTLRARFVGQGYKQVCGQADVWGDGVVPEVSAHLKGALNICFDGVYHSPVGADDETRPWYGSPDVLEQWVEHLLN